MLTFAPRLLLIALLVSGGWYLAQRYRVAGLDKITLLPREGSTATGRAGGTALSVVATSHNSASSGDVVGGASAGDPVARRTLRIGLFNLDRLSFDSISDAETRQRIARLIRQMDVLALQGVKSRGSFDIDELVAEANRGGATYSSVSGPMSGGQRLAFIFNAERVEIDVAQTYSVADPGEVLQTDPLVGWFRAVGVPPARAWTFSLVNLSIQQASEASLIRSVYDAVRSDRRAEDDCVIALGISTRELGGFQTIRESGLHHAVPDKPTTILADAHLDNLVFGADSLPEFTGQGGVIDFLRAENLSLDEARAISTHSPVWGRFLILEQATF